MTLKQTIADYLQKKEVWLHKGDILKVTFYNNDKTTAMPNTVDRTLRKLEEESTIAQRPAGKSIEYRYLPEKYRKAYIPFSSREKGKEDILFRN